MCPPIPRGVRPDAPAVGRLVRFSEAVAKGGAERSIRQHGVPVQGPLHTEVGIERVHTTLVLRRVRGGAQVENGTSLLEGQEGVPQTLGDVDGPGTPGLQQDGIPGAEVRRVRTQVDDDVEDGSAHTSDVFGLSGIAHRIVHTAENVPPRHRPVGLCHIYRQTGSRLQGIVPEPFEEYTPVVVVQSRLVYPSPCDLQWFHGNETGTGDRCTHGPQY